MIKVIGSGYLGTRISQALSCDYFSSNLESRKYNLDDCDCVINCLGATGNGSIDWCETHQEETYEANVIAAMKLCDECYCRGIHFIHLSSGCIYQGYNNWKEEDVPNYLNQYYSITKIQAEREILKIDPNACILRIRLPIDYLPHPRNLIDKLLKYLYLSNRVNQYTILPSFINVLKCFVYDKPVGIFNCVNSGLISPCGIMELYKKYVDPTYRFEAMLEESSNRSYCSLDNSKINLWGNPFPDINIALEEVLKQYNVYKRF